MTQQFPPQPWNVGDTFVNDETDVEYTFNGEQWLASGGPQVEGEYLPLTGGNITGATSIANGNQVALTIKNGNTDKIKFWGSGAVALVSGYTDFKDNELITKKYADDAIKTAVDNVDLDSYLPLTGGTITGDLKVEGVVKTLNVDSGQGSNLNLKCNGNTKIYVGPNETTIQGRLKLNTEGVQDSDVVTKAYVDAAVGDNTEEDNGKSRLSLGTYTLRTTAGQPSGNATAGELTLWHLDPSEPETTPVQEFKVGGGYGHNAIFALVQDIIEKSLGDQPPVWYFVQGDKEQRMVGQGQGWTTTGTYHSSGVEYSGDVLTGGQEVELFVEADLNYVWQKQEEILPEVADNYVAKSGSTMTGALTVNRSSNQVLIAKKDNTTNAEIFVDGTFTTTKTSFADNNLVTKKYVEDRLTTAGGFNPGDRVAKDGNSSIAVGGMYLQNGNLYVKVS